MSLDLLSATSVGCQRAAHNGAASRETGIYSIGGPLPYWFALASFFLFFVFTLKFSDIKNNLTPFYLEQIYDAHKSVECTATIYNWTVFDFLR
jgi:hypothetical protein